jgi:hypothetical protein
MNTVIEFPNDEAWVTGSHLLRRFQDSLFRCLSEQLEPKYGKEWFEKTVVPALNPNDTVDKDLSGLLSQIIRYENQNFRLAVALSFFKKTFLTKEQEAALKSIRRLRNRWYHESSEVKSKIRISNLEELALAIQVFATDLNLEIECNSVLSGIKEGNVTQALFSLSWIARHLEQRSIETNSYKMLQNELKIWKNEYANLANSAEDFERLNRLTKMLEHAYQSLNFQYLFLMHSYHSFQKDLLDMLEEDPHEKPDAKSVSLLEESKKYQFISPVKFLTWEEHELDTIDSAFNLLRESQGGEKCDCEYCAQIPGVMSPFTVEDNERNDFLRKLLKRDNGVIIARLFLSK